ncbi:MAG: AAA family ATPase [Cellulomonadaceae bacterium]|nr:AAA family ATPase [Cellulomonadaceae bacterium]
MAQSDGDLTDALGRAVDRIEATGNRDAVKSGRTVPTGFRGLDALAAITCPSVTLVFGAPGVGTSTFALNVAMSSARAGIPALLVSWESPEDEVMARLIAAQARVHTQKIRTGQMDEDSWQKMAGVVQLLADLPFQIVPGPRTFNRLEAVIREWFTDRDRAQGGVVILDGAPNLARLASSSEQAAWDEHSRLSANIRYLAYELGVAVVVTTPVVREALRRVAVRPLLPDVAYSPAYVHDADVVLGLFREDQWERESPRAGEADVIMLKSKHSPTDTVTLAFQGHYSRFVDMRIEDKVSAR